MIRLFVALEPPEALRQRLARLGGGIPGARWVAEPFLHVTLRFIGEVGEERMPDIDDALRSVRAGPLDVVLGGCGTFPRGGKPHTLWVGVDRSEPLRHLRDKVESALVRGGLEPEGRRFLPHLTLARLSGRVSPERVRDFIAGNNLFHAPFEVGHFTLFSSRKSAEGSVYTAEALYPLDRRTYPERGRSHR